jgi:type IV secretory pathway VirB2 component (pilin)
MFGGRKLIALVMLFFGSQIFIGKLSLSYAAIELSDPSPSKEKSGTSLKDKPADKPTVNKKLNLAENNPVAALLCKAIRAFTGTISKIIAVILLIGLGVTLLQSTAMNPINPVTIVSFIIGIGIFFSSEYLVGKLMGDAGYGGDKNRACDCKYGISNCDV